MTMPSAMRKLARAVLLLCLAALPAAPAAALELKIATWNLEWLTLRPDADLPEDAHTKRLDDIATLARYARHLNADVVGVEEVDGADMAARMFPRADYRIEMIGDPVIQQTGIAIRRDYQVIRNPDVIGLDTYGRHAKYPLRSGLDVTISRDGHNLRILVVHLKTGCWSRPLNAKGPRACQVLRTQLHVLQDWLSARSAEGVPFVLMGDFNRNMPAHDPFLEALDQAAPMSLATAGYISPCWGGEAFIDHILTGGAARGWMEPGSLRVMVYREKDPAMKERISDHCAVSVRLDTGR